MRRLFWLGFTLLFVFSLPTYSDTAFTQRKDVQAFIKQMVKKYHFNEKELTNTLSQVQIQPKIIESMDKPYEKKNWDIYRNTLLTPERLKAGLDFWAANRKALEKAQKRYGVPPEIIIAILGVESLYGERQGEYRVVDALATLAFNYPRRAQFFTKELTEYLILCREHKIPVTYYKGSYAGAFGKPQFMPSSFRNYAVDFSNKGTKDIVNNNEDSIASIANYFHQKGWRMNEGIAQSAQINTQHRRPILMNPNRANYTYQQLISSGIKPVTAAHNHPSRAGVLELTTAEGNEYWIAYPNFFVITRYNPSAQYALAVYLLSQQLKQQWTQTIIKKHRAYV